MPAWGAPKVRDEAVRRKRARTVQHAPGNGGDGQPRGESRRGRRGLRVPSAREPRRAVTRLQAPRFLQGRRGDISRPLARHHVVAPHCRACCAPDKAQSCTSSAFVFARRSLGLCQKIPHSRILDTNSGPSQKFAGPSQKFAAANVEGLSGRGTIHHGGSRAAPAHGLRITTLRSACWITSRQTSRCGRRQVVEVLKPSPHGVCVSACVRVCVARL